MADDYLTRRAAIINARLADKLSKRPRIMEHRAITAQQKQSCERAALGVNDILETFGCTHLLESPEEREMLRRISAALNSKIR